MISTYLLNVHVYDFASFEVFVEKCDNDILCFGNNRQEFGFNDLDVGAMAESLVVLLLFILRAHVSNTLFFKLAQDFF